jgi:hypothetical protein
MNMKRSDLELPVYFDRYMLLAEDLDPVQSLEISLQELETIPWETWESLGDRVYAPGKWTLRDLLQHILDTERIFAYRALAFARGETQAASYDEDVYAAAAAPIQRPLVKMVQELKLLRQSTIALFQSFTTLQWMRSGMGFKGPYKVVDIAYILAGHQRWHFRVVEERYLPMLVEHEIE